jgi:hypothetical protein
MNNVNFTKQPDYLNDSVLREIDIWVSSKVLNLQNSGHIYTPPFCYFTYHGQRAVLVMRLEEFGEFFWEARVYWCDKNLSTAEHYLNQAVFTFRTRQKFYGDMMQSLHLYLNFGEQYS